MTNVASRSVTATRGKDTRSAAILPFGTTAVAAVLVACAAPITEHRAPPAKMIVLQSEEGLFPPRTQCIEDWDIGGLLSDPKGYKPKLRTNQP